MQVVGLEEKETYISRRHNTVVKYIVTQPILGICLEVEKRMGLRVPKWWWNQLGLDLAVLRKVFREERGEDREGTEEWLGVGVGDGYAD